MIPDFLQTIAEISIGLAGFSGLIVALRKTPGPLSDVPKYRLRILFAMTFGAMFLSLLPDVLNNFHSAHSRIWFLASAAMFAYSAVFVFWMIRRARQLARIVPEIFNWLVFCSLVAGHIIVLLLQFAVLTGFITDSAPGAFGAGLVWYLMHAAQQFVRMMFILPRDTEHG